jgi:cytoskeleton protein RodZ
MTVFQIGASLKEARTKRGLTTADVVKELRLRERYLNALEEEHWDQLPAEAYVKGFLRMYAEFLGLNGSLYIDEYNARFAHREEEPFVPEPQAIRHERRRPRGVVRTVLAVAVVGTAVAGLAAWQLGGSPDANTPLPKPVVARNAAPASTPVAKKKSKPVAPARPTFAVISANARCWLQARAGGPHGALIYEGTLTAGSTKKFSLSRTVWVRMGNPLALAITVGGRPVSGLSANPSNLLLSRRGAQSA